MGSLNPVSLVSAGLNAIPTAVNLASQVGIMPSPAGRQLESEQKLALQQLQARQELQQQQLEADAALDRERLAADATAAEKDRRNALRRAVARQRARFGASGIGNAGGGSAEAVLLGLFDETEDELAERQRLDTLRSQALSQSVEGRQSLNVLQRTQLQERQRFERELLDGRFFF